ncbi:MAG: isoleucine--tRNA ligase [Acidimicrobiia bacterium]
MAAPRRYPDVDPSPNLPAIERAVIASWDEQRTFERSIERRADAEEFVFYDGPPFANGLPHYGHLLTGFIKDALPRYKTMRGYRVERRFGWDTHGLPVEMAAEQELGVSGRDAILQLGVDRFNAHCRSLVGTTADVWHSYVTRSARWVDMVNDYKTMDLEFMESVMWAVKQLHEKGLLYEGYRVLPYCWECETPLSNFETRLDDSYRERQDPALTVWFELETGERILVWTTTPWTLPSNLALAVGADIDYALFEEDGVRYVIGEATVGKYERELAGATRVGTVKGAELAGRRYTPMFPWFADTPNAFRVLTAEFVSTEDGTGTVHLAPGFGEDDQRVCEEHGIPVVCPVDQHGAFTSEVPDYAGVQVFVANPAVVRDLKERGVVVRHDSYVHAYPHCWRTDTPLIYKAVSSWFVKVTAIKDRMVELNQEIEWVPAHIRDGSFGKWLEGARDWSISRNRFWGSPIPVWKSDDPAFPRVDVYGSLDELERDFGVRPADLHRPGIDELTRPNPDDPTGRSTMRRVEDVLDCWFESGSMPYAQVHYPFENRAWFDGHFPGDFIVEYIGQTRGWFYTLHVLSTALFDRPAFSTAVVHGVLLGDDGQKLSKRLQNYPDPIEVFDTLGSDAMRWALLASPAVRGGDMAADRRPMEEAVRQVLLPIWNAWYFLALYANAAGTAGGDGGGSDAGDGSDHVLDRFVLARTATLVGDVTRQLDAYDLSGACASVTSFLDALNNWYVRRSRDRFWAGDQAAIDTLHRVLHTLCRVAAPLLPLLTERVYRDLSGEDSVHLVDWPAPGELPGDPELVAAMETVRAVCSAASSVRKANGVRVRQPLPGLAVSVANPDVLRPFVGLIADEVNVKAVELLAPGSLGTERIEVDLKVVGRTLGPDTPKVVAAMKEGNYELSADGAELRVLDHRFGPGQFTRRLLADDPTSTASLDGGRGLVRLDLAVTPELEAEGLVRDLVRLVNQLRRDRGLDVSDRIRLVLDPHHHADVTAAAGVHRDLLAAETLAAEVVVVEHGLADGHRLELPDGRAITAALHVVAGGAGSGPSTHAP